MSIKGLKTKFLSVHVSAFRRTTGKDQAPSVLRKMMPMLLRGTGNAYSGSAILSRVLTFFKGLFREDLCAIKELKLPSVQAGGADDTSLHWIP